MRQAAVINAINPITRDQAGFVTTGQARAVGVPARDLDRLARRGLMRRARHGVYAVALGRPDHPHDDVVSAWLAVEQLPSTDRPPRAVVSHASAAAIHAIGSALPERPEITQARQSSRRPDLRIHVAPLGPDDWEVLQVGGLGVPVTTPARTVVDLVAAGDDPDHIARAVRDAFPDADIAAVAVERAARARRRRSDPLVAEALEIAMAAWET